MKKKTEERKQERHCNEISEREINKIGSANVYKRCNKVQPDIQGQCGNRPAI